MASQLDYDHAYREIARLQVEIDRQRLVIEDRERTIAVLEAKLAERKRQIATP